jgi:hypothetical protein
MSMTARNLDWLRSVKVEGVPGFGARLHECVTDIINGVQNIEQQTNTNASGTPAAPPPIDSVTVTPTSVGHHVSIQHGAEFYRGAHYHVEYADNPAFTNPFPAYSGPAREIDLATGNKTLYVRAFPSYNNTGNAEPAYHGGAIPLPVTGGTAGNHLVNTSQGSGTGQPGQGLQGFGQAPFRSVTGAPPTRGTK